MQRRPSSLRTHLVGLICAAAIPDVVLIALAAIGTPTWIELTAGLAGLVTLAALVFHIRRRIAEALRSLTTTVVRIARGETVPVSSFFQEGHEVARALTAVSAELKRRAEEAEDGERRYKALAESLPALVWIMTFDGRTVYQNRRVRDYVGEASTEDHLARNAIIHPDDVSILREARLKGIETLQEYTTELRLRRHDGTYRWHLVTMVPLTFPAAEDNRAYWLATAMDIQSLKEAEELQARLTSVLESKVAEATVQLREETAVRQKAEGQLRQTQKMEAISRLTGGMAHDLNNKLMVISANVDAVTKQVKDQPQLRRKLLSALVASDQAAQLISKLLAFARQRDLQVQYTNVAEHLDSLAFLLDRSFLSDSVEVALSIPEDLWPVEVDPHEFETAIVNLAVNACDAMPAGGTISIDVRNIRVRKGSLSDPELAGDFVQITVRDSGEGIAPQDLERVFEPFFTTKDANRSSGLGLSQVHGFARQLGGTVEISSQKGEGTSVALYLPRAELPARIGSRPDPQDLMEDEDETEAFSEILVVDDEVEVALALQGMLEESGYAVRIAIGADEALDSIRARKPNLVLTDVTMPGTMDGVQLAREIRKVFPSLPVVLITGNPMVVAGSSEFPLLQKPIVSRDLHAAIQRHLVPTGHDRVVPLFPDRSRGQP